MALEAKEKKRKEKKRKEKKRQNERYKDGNKEIDSQPDRQMDGQIGRGVINRY